MRRDALEVLPRQFQFPLETGSHAKRRLSFHSRNARKDRVIGAPKYGVDEIISARYY